MNVYLFAIGGTGARVLRSLTFCLASGMECIPNGTNFIPMIIDYDKTNGDKTRTIKLLETYSEIRRRAYDGVTIDPQDHSLFLPEIQYLANVATIAGGGGTAIAEDYEFRFGKDAAVDHQTFADFLDYRFLAGDTFLTKDLLATLYNDEPETAPLTELNLDLSVGFKGNPNIGSVIFENLKDDAEFKKFCNSFDPTQDRVFIISSIFGGTGSSGFPRIVDAIRYAGITGYDQALVGAAIVQPYFKVNTPAGGAINSNIFNSKEKAALSYYNQKDDHGQSLFDKLTAAYFVGEDKPSVLHYSEGSTDQKNEAHFAELLAALSIIDFVSKDKNALLADKQYEFGLETEPQPTENIQLNHLDDDSQEKYFDYIARMALAFKYYEDYVYSGEIPPKTAYYASMGLDGQLGKGMYDALKAFVEDFDEWLDEMSVQTDAFKPFLQKPRNADGSVPVAADLGDYIAGYAAKEGGMFSSGASYKDFNSYCNKLYKDYGLGMSNECALLKIFYDAADKTLDYYNEQ